MVYIEKELERIAAIVAQISAEHPDDAELLADMVEGCTDLHELASRLHDQYADSVGMMAVTAERIKDLQARKKRFTARMDSYKAAVARLMDAAKTKKLELPEATYSLSQRKPKRVVTDESALPDKFCKITRKPDMAAIKAAEKMPPGVTMDNGGETITVRTK